MSLLHLARAALAATTETENRKRAPDDAPSGRFRHWRITDQSGVAKTVTITPDATKGEVAQLYFGAHVQHWPDQITRRATLDDMNALRGLIGVVLGNGSDVDRAEALTVGLADPDAALTSFRALAGPALRDRRSDDRIRCLDCRNLTPIQRCAAAARGEIIGAAGSSYAPVTDLPRRCASFLRSHDWDTRTGGERWPHLELHELTSRATAPAELGKHLQKLVDNAART